MSNVIQFPLKKISNNNYQDIDLNYICDVNNRLQSSKQDLKDLEEIYNDLKEYVDLVPDEILLKKQVNNLKDLLDFANQALDLTVNKNALFDYIYTKVDCITEKIACEFGLIKVLDD